MGRQGLARLLAVAGIALAAVAGGALLPGSAPVRAADVTLGTAPPAVPGVADSGPAPVSQTAPPTMPPVAGPSPQQPGNMTAPDPGELPTMTAYTGDQIPAIKPAPAKHLTIPAIGVDVDILPVDNYPTGRLNQWGGEIYSAIDFPVDQYARQWVRRGNPNSLPAAKSADNVKAFDRTFLYGHASDIGNHLIFQDLAALTKGDIVLVDTKRGHFSYAVTAVLTSQKVDLDNFAELYDYPANGAKELALVACLPDTTSNVVVLATLIDARAA